MTRGTRGRRVVAVAAGSLLTLAGCTAPGASFTLPEHVHSARFTDSSTLLIATHAGLYQLEIDQDQAMAAGPVGDVKFDLMGFTLAGERAYASGHPDASAPAEFGRPNLGLITSDDLGVSWAGVSRQGETDFHALTAAEDQSGTRIYALGSDGAPLQRSLDAGVTWSDGAAILARDIVADPTRVGVLYATTADGLAVSDDDGSSFTVDTTAPRLLLLAVGGRGELSGVDIAGTVWARSDGGDWKQGGQTAAPQAIAFDSATGTFAVVTETGVETSTDLGLTWTKLMVTG